MDPINTPPAPQPSTTPNPTPTTPPSPTSGLQSDFAKEPENQKMILGGAVVALVATFLPWMSIPLGVVGNMNINGLRGFGLLTFLSSLVLILRWILPRFGIQPPQPMSDENKLRQILTGVALAGPSMWLLQSNGGMLGSVGIGLWLALLASGTMVFFAFKK